LVDDLILLVPSVRTGTHAVSGYLDPKLTSTTQEGDKRIYSRDSGGDSISQVWLKNTGEVVISNNNGTFTLEAGGDIVLNGVRITPSGNITGAATLEVAGKEIKDHDHDIVSGSSAPGPTGPNN
jgi:hypothetical protein